MPLTNYLGVPGMGIAVLSAENAFLWGPDTWYLLKSIQLDSGTVDSGNTPTTDLRPGLVLGTITSSGNFSNYLGTNTNGTSVAQGVLFTGVQTLSPLTGVAENKLAQCVVAGPLKGGSLYGLDQQARGQLFGRCILDDDLIGNRFPFRDTVAKTANYTVLTSDRDICFTTTGATASVTFTLPAPAKGLRFRFCNTVGQTMAVTAAAAGKLVAFNNAAATSITFSTAGNLIGAVVEIISDEAGAKWIANVLCTNTATIA